MVSKGSAIGHTGSQFLPGKSLAQQPQPCKPSYILVRNHLPPLVICILTCSCVSGDKHPSLPFPTCLSRLKKVLSTTTKVTGANARSSVEMTLHVLVAVIVFALHGLSIMLCKAMRNLSVYMYQ